MQDMQACSCISLPCLACRVTCLLRWLDGNALLSRPGVDCTLNTCKRVKWSAHAQQWRAARIQ